MHDSHPGTPAGKDQPRRWKLALFAGACLVFLIALWSGALLGQTSPLLREWVPRVPAEHDIPLLPGPVETVCWLMLLGLAIYIGHRDREIPTGFDAAALVAALCSMASLVCLFRGLQLLANGWSRQLAAMRWRPRVHELALAFALVGLIAGLVSVRRLVRSPRRRGALLACYGILSGPFWAWLVTYLFLAPVTAPRFDPPDFRLAQMQGTRVYVPDPRERQTTVLVMLSDGEVIVIPSLPESRHLDWREYLRLEAVAAHKAGLNEDGSGPLIPDSPVLLRIDERVPMEAVVEVLRACSKEHFWRILLVTDLSNGPFDGVTINYLLKESFEPPKHRMGEYLSRSIRARRDPPNLGVVFVHQGVTGGDLMKLHRSHPEPWDMVCLRVDGNVRWGELAPQLSGADMVYITQYTD